MTTSWTCPFCPLLCDDLTAQARQPDGVFELVGGDCALAHEALHRFGATSPTATPTLNGRACELDEAITAAARLLAGSRQPLFAGLGTDVAGARALYRLACETGAICDAVQGAALMHGQRTLQDHGGYSTTLAEVRTRADLVVFIGGLQRDRAPRLCQRCGIGDAVVPDRQVVLLGGSDDDLATLQDLPHTRAEAVPLHGDLYDTMGLLACLVAGRTLREPGPGASGWAPWAGLAQRLRDARYAVFIGATGALPEHGALVMEVLQRMVAELNRRTRAAALWVGGGGGASTANQVFTWLSGLPLRSRAGPAGLEHEPWRFDGTRLLEDGAVDTLLWVSSLDPAARPPATTLPRVLLGLPEAAPASGGSGEEVFIPVAAPGIDEAGHLFRTDGIVVKPLFAVRRVGLPSVPEVVGRIAMAVHQIKAGRAA
jgi:formylmethanofuran dehydrogenase subunit B